MLLALLSLLDNIFVPSGVWDICCWSPDPSKGFFSALSRFFCVLPSPYFPFVLFVVEGQILCCGRFYIEVLTLWIAFRGTPPLLVHSGAFFLGRHPWIWVICFGFTNLLSQFEMIFTRLSLFV